jgi:hypothetical protein
VIAPFRFVPKLEDRTYSKRWLTVFPTYGMLIKPDDSIDITLSVYIDKNTAHTLNSGTDTLDDILVLKVENGMDFFISVSVRSHATLCTVHSECCTLSYGFAGSLRTVVLRLFAARAGGMYTTHARNKCCGGPSTHSQRANAIRTKRAVATCGYTGKKVQHSVI